MCAPHYYGEPNGGRRIAIAVVSTVVSAFFIGTFAWAWALNAKVSKLETQLTSLRVEMISEIKSQRLEMGLVAKALDRRVSEVEKDHKDVLGRPNVPRN